MNEGGLNKIFICCVLGIGAIVSFILVIKGKYAFKKLIYICVGLLGYILTIPSEKFAPKKE